MAIERGDIHHFRYFDYGEAFYGSYKGMRYRVAIEPLENVFYKSQEEKEKYAIKAWAWSEPFNFNSAENKLSEEFPYTEEGVEAAVNWLNKVYPDLV